MSEKRKGKSIKGKKTKENQRKKNPLILLFGNRIARLAAVIALAVIVLGSVGILIYQRLFKPMVIVSYGLSDAETKALEATVAAYRDAAKTRAIIVKRAAEGKNLKSYAEKGASADIVCFRPGREALEAASLFRPVPQEIGDLVSMSLRIPVQSGPGMYALPLSIGHFELSYDRNTFRNKGLKAPESLAAFEAAAATIKKTGAIPAVIAGKDDESLLALVAYLVAGPRGLEPYEELCQEIASGKGFEEIIGLEPGEAGLSLSQALAPLVSWVRKGYLPPSWLEMDKAAVKNLVERGNAAMFMVLLSDHRAIGAQSLESFETLRFPAFPGREASSVVGPMLAAGIPVKGGSEKLARGFLAYCASAEGQARLCAGTGNAPTVAAVSAPDIQARDVRQWAIMSERVLQGPAVDGFTDTREAAAFAQDLRTWLVRETQK
jgi:hypothetical protein